MQALQRKYKSGGCINSIRTHDPRYFGSSRWSALVDWWNNEQRKKERQIEMKEAAVLSEQKRRAALQVVKQAEQNRPGSGSIMSRMFGRVRSWFGAGGQK
jgi:hypothetical protein